MSNLCWSQKERICSQRYESWLEELNVWFDDAIQTVNEDFLLYSFFFFKDSCQKIIWICCCFFYDLCQSVTLMYATFAFFYTVHVPVEYIFLLKLDNVYLSKLQFVRKERQREREREREKAKKKINLNLIFVSLKIVTFFLVSAYPCLPCIDLSFDYCNMVYVCKCIKSIFLTKFYNISVVILFIICIYILLLFLPLQIYSYGHINGTHLPFFHCFLQVDLRRANKTHLKIIMLPPPRIIFLASRTTNKGSAIWSNSINFSLITP